MPEMVISADSHLLEPGDLFATRLPQNLREHAIRVDVDDRFFHYGMGDTRFFSISRHMRGEGDLLDHNTIVSQREADLDADGVWGELVHPDLGLFCFQPDNELAFAHARVYNDYAYELLGARFDRHKPTAVIPLTDVDDAVAEVERVAGLGFRAIMVPTEPPVRYATATFDRVWAAAQANGMLVAFHIGTGIVNRDQGDLADKMTAGGMIGGGTTPETIHADRLRDGIDGALSLIPGQRVIADLVGGGILERFPELHFISVEFHAHWLASLMMFMDKAYTLGLGQDVSAPFASIGIYDFTRGPDDQPMMGKLFGLNDGWPYPLRPSDYVRRQVHCAFMDDPGALLQREYTGIESLVWGSDYPHHEATWPRSQALLDQQFAGIPADERAAIVGGTLGKLLGFEVPAQN